MDTIALTQPLRLPAITYDNTETVLNDIEGHSDTSIESYNSHDGAESSKHEEQQHEATIRDVETNKGYEGVSTVWQKNKGDSLEAVPSSNATEKSSEDDMDEFPGSEQISQEDARSPTYKEHAKYQWVESDSEAEDIELEKQQSSSFAKNSRPLTVNHVVDRERPLLVGRSRRQSPPTTSSSSSSSSSGVKVQKPDNEWDYFDKIQPSVTACNNFDPSWDIQAKKKKHKNGSEYGQPISIKSKGVSLKVRFASSDSESDIKPSKAGEYIQKSRKSGAPSTRTKSKSKKPKKIQVTKKEPLFTWPSNRIHQDIRVPPFLAWPAESEHERGSPDARPGRNSTARKQSDKVLIPLILRSIERRIHQVTEGVAGQPRTALLVIWRKADARVSVAEQFIPRKSSSDLEIYIQEFEDHLGSSISKLNAAHHSFENLGEEPGLGESGDANEGGSNNATIFDQNPNTDEPLNRRISTRNLLLWHGARLCIERDTFVVCTRKLVEQFVPKHYTHSLVDRCWGSLGIINQLILDTCQEICDLERGSYQKQDDLEYVVKDVQNDGYAKLHQLGESLLSPNECRKCRRSNQYSSFDEAIRHVKAFHAHNPSEDIEKLQHYVVSKTKAKLEDEVERFLEHLRSLTQRAIKLLERAVDMRQSVTDDHQQLPDGYLLPPLLVIAAEKVFQFIYYSAFSLHAVQKYGTPPQGPDLLTSSPEHQKDSSAAECFATLADIAMSKGRDDLLLMTHTDLESNAVMHLHSFSQITLLFGLSCITTKRSMWDMSIVQLYRAHLSSLRFESSRRPTKRVLRELYLLDEEVEIVASVYSQQIKALKVFLRLNENIKELKDSEVLKKFLSNLDDISKLRNEIGKNAQALRHNIEVMEEGNSKAIFIFTLVTIIFLPLSFVASVFGMNTSDVRNMNTNQWLFWAIALPVTAMVGGLSLLAAYGDFALRNGVEKSRNFLKLQRRALLPERFPRRRKRRSRDEEKADILEKTLPSKRDR